MLGVGPRRILCQHVPKVTLGTRAQNYSRTGITPGPGPAWDGKDLLVALGQREDIVAVQRTVDRAAVVPSGGPRRRLMRIAISSTAVPPATHRRHSYTHTSCIASSRRPHPPSCGFFLRVSPEGWPWWPWWPSMAGHGSRRRAAKPRLGIGAPRPLAWNPRVLGRLPHGPRPCRPAWYPTSAPGCLATAPRVTFRLVATMATMATPRGPTSKKKSHAGYQLVVYHPLHLSLAFFFSRFNLGVAMVAMVAMTREPPQRPRKPRPVREDAACRRCGARDAPSARGTGTLEHGRRAATPGGHQSWTNPTILPGYPTSAPGCLATAPRVDFWPVATMATMATPAGQPLKKISTRRS